jgi:hypothetical protein
MAQPKVVTVRLERQPHHDAVLRVRTAYRRLRRLAGQPAMSDPLDSPASQPISSPLQEVVAWPK